MKLTSDKGVAHDSQLAGITQSNVLRLAISHLTIDQTCRRSLDALHGTQQKFNLVMGHCCFWRTFRFVSTGVSRTLCTKCKGGDGGVRSSGRLSSAQKSAVRLQFHRLAPQLWGCPVSLPRNMGIATMFQTELRVPYGVRCSCGPGVLITVRFFWVIDTCSGSASILVASMSRQFQLRVASL